MESLPIFPILIFSIVVHEVAHGLTALKLGDPTARDLGRLTLNPIPHIDLFGSILVPLMSYLAAGTVFIAWAKPVPVNPMYFKHFRRDDILVSAAGPISNFIVAGGCALLYVVTLKLFGPLQDIPEGFERSFVTFLNAMFLGGITLNIFLAVFNLIPVPPLDGSHVLASLLPAELGNRYRQIGFFGIIAVMLLMRVEPFRDLILSLVRGLIFPYRLLIDLLA
ncbi:MAG: site-2 protease family protein [Ignavibacteriales bacterium]|nr:site-2 protease family protein [Ignavibacteriales bacterium]